MATAIVFFRMDDEDMESDHILDLVLAGLTHRGSPTV